MDRKPLTVVLLVLFLLAGAEKIFAQVSIAPPALFFDKQNRFSSLIVDNSSPRAQEVTVKTYFGYTASKNGKAKIVRDSVLAKGKSIAEWIKAFPKKFTLQPNQRQTIRFVVRPPADLEPGGYWTRVQVRSNPVSPPIEDVDNNKIGAQVDLVINQIISAYYLTPDAKTGVRVNSIDFNKIDSTQNGNVTIAMEQTKNTPFIGTLQFSIKNTDGKTIYKTGTTISVYTKLSRTFNIENNVLPAGNYTITGKITSNRPDLKDQKVLKIDPVSFRKQIAIE